jgi:DNA-directed RNA polymerase beta subunit
MSNKIDMKKNSKKGSRKLSKKGSKKETPKARDLSRALDDDTQLSKNAPNNLDINDIFKFVELYFNRYGILFGHLYNSFNKFLDEDVVNFLTTGDHTFFEKLTKDKVIKYKFKYENISIKNPTLENDVEPMFPTDARSRNMSYASKLTAKITQIQEITDIATNEVVTRVIGQPDENYPIANIPIMMRSRFCSLSMYPEHDKRECEYDPGGYFVVNGSEKVIISQDRMVENKPLVFIKKDSGMDIYTVQVNSKSYKPHGLTQVNTIRMKKDKIMTIHTPILNEVPVFTVFRALGIESDRDILNYIVYADSDFEKLDLLDIVDTIKISLDNCRNEKGDKIQTQQDAIEFLVNKMRILKKYSETDKKVKDQQKRLHLMDLFKNNFLPHIEGDVKVKAYYLGYMINKLIKCYLGKNGTVPDDRDSYLNKRIDLPGDLLMELFKQFYRKMLNDCNKFFKKRNSSDDDPLNVINQIKPNIIEQGIRASLLTGAWPRRKGVAQMLQRLTYLQTISFLRRVDAPGGDASTSKLTSPRHLHLSSASFLCCLTGDSMIMQSDGTYKRIDQMKNGDSVITVYKEDLREAPSVIQKYFSKMPDKLLQITTLTGRILKCTTDHPILVKKDNKYEMIHAGQLRKGMQLISVYNSNESLQDEYDKYKANVSQNFRNRVIYAYEKFRKEWYIGNRKLAVPIAEIKEIPPEIVYDFETKLDSHSFIVNGIVTSNCVQTPEHAKVGLTKHLNIISSVTIFRSNQVQLIKSFLKKKLTDMRDVSSRKIRDMTKVFLNGDWLGLSKDPFKLEEELRANKTDGGFEPTTAIVHNILEKEIKIYCDGGRMYRPTMKVENNVVKLTLDHIKSISLNKSEKDTKITSWDGFMKKNPRIIEYIDTEEQPYLMLSDRIQNVEEMRKTMVNSLKTIPTTKTNMVNNRYDEMMYVKYSHCDFHPSLLLGEIATNIPFCNHNAGPRNIFQYAQGKQAMGVYISNYRDRLDISYILYHPQKPLITTRTAKFIYSDVLPSGENVVVAIACYSGLTISPCYSKSYSKSVYDRQRY